jgi:UDP-N-acetylglucosamine 2-epimerase (non-hydrolysing)
MKIAPLMKEFYKYRNRFMVKLVHTGQHYDFRMSEIFFDHLNIPKPDIFLNVGSGSHAVQTAKIIEAFEKVVIKEKPDLVVVVGDVNSTLACSLVSTKLNVKVAHVEAGLRSFDRTMPEEINRIVTDSLSDYLFVSEPSGLVNLKKEGVDKKKVFFVGNVMIDTLLSHKQAVNRSNILKDLSLEPKTYCALTLHRPSNVDSRQALGEIFEILNSIPKEIKIVYPIHPRTKKMIEKNHLIKTFKSLENLIMLEPLGYIDFVRLVKDSRFVLTDSGGIQEETMVLNVPCITMRENTERPITIKEGTNVLAGRDKRRIVKMVNDILKGRWKKGHAPKLWDGKTSIRIVKIIRADDIVTNEFSNNSC